MKRIIFILLTLSASTGIIFSQKGNFNDSVAFWFGEIKASTAQYKELWSHDLYGPILLVDPVNRKIYSNYPDSAGVLKQDGKIFAGLLPDKVNIANTSINWNGRSWAMIMLPLPGNRAERLDLLSHELFHRSQPGLGFHMYNTGNNHLDERDGRIYLRLELEALGKAIKAAKDSEGHDHLADALFFRRTRYSLFPGAESEENRLELNEGLATYTGIMMSGRNEKEINEYFERRLTEFKNYPTFVRSFAYLTIPLYGCMLNRSDKYWNRQIKDTTSLTDYFIKAFRLSIPSNLCPVCFEQYGYSEILNEETTRAEEKAERINAFKRTFIEQPHLEIKLEKMNISFDPRNIIPVEGHGTVYPTMRISDNWGILTVTGGALLGTNWDKVTVSEPLQIGPGTVSGHGWALEINEDYTLEKNKSDNNYFLKRR